MTNTTQTGLEPVTSAVTGRRSNQLSHWAIEPSKLNIECFVKLSVNAIDLLVTFSYIHYCTSTYDLSTLSSSRGLYGYLILRGASRLDAFSVYPVQTWLLCDRIGS